MPGRAPDCASRRTTRAVSEERATHPSTSASPHFRLIRVYWGPLLLPHLARFRSETRALAPILASQVFVQTGPFGKGDTLPASRLSQSPGPGLLDGVRHIRATLKAEVADAIITHGFVATLLTAVARVGTSRLPIVYEVHGAAAFEVWRRHANHVQAAARAGLTYVLETLAIMVSDRLFLVSNAITRFYPAARLKPSLSVPRLLDAAPDEAAVLPQALLGFVDRARSAGRRIVVFSGGTDEWQMLDDSLRFMNALVERGGYAAIVLTPGVDIVLRKLGDIGSTVGEWFVTALPQQAVSPALAQCDVGMLLRQRAVLNTVASPTKLYEYLYAGLAVVTTDGVPEAVAAIAETGGGVVISVPVAEGDVMRIEQALVPAIERAHGALGNRPRYLWASAAEEFRRFLTASGGHQHG